LAYLLGIELETMLNRSPIEIVADDREREAGVIESLQGIANVSVRIERLAAGDYLADRRILFERKTLQDVARSIVDGRLFKQMVRLAESNEETARLIVYSARQVAWLGKEGYQRAGYRPKSQKGRQLYILQGLPGVGHERALRLLEKFGSVEGVLRAGRDDLLTVEGVGAKTADRIRWAVSEKIESYGGKTLLSIKSL
jgi:DNA excision repair protein ERCC-4